MSKVVSILIAMAAISVLASGPAHAGDPYSLKDAPHGETIWTGFYVGIQGGYGWGDTRHDFGLIGTKAFDADGGLIGLTMGKNWQSGNWVYGLEGDFSFSNMDGTFDEGACGVFLCSTELRNLGTARLRLGYAAGSSLLYITGGLAYGTVWAGDRHFLVDISSDGKESQLGWTLGGGVEWAVAPGWSVKAEYLHVDLGKRSVYTSSLGDAADVGLTADIARIGVNYSFSSDF